MSKAHEVSFDRTPEEDRFVEDIASRAQRAGLVFKGYSRQTLKMDLIATNANGNPIDFGRLLNADDFNFSHDICGIARHLDRTTGQLGGWFSPRFSKPTPAVTP